MEMVGEQSRGGVRLWDGEKEIMLAPISMRTARVKKEGNFSQMEMLSEDVPYKGKKVDILLRVTAYSGLREMRVEAFALTDDDVQFATGVNYWDEQDRTQQGIEDTRTGRKHRIRRLEKIQQVES